jgi:hypothetical protein
MGPGKGGAWQVAQCSRQHRPSEALLSSLADFSSSARLFDGRAAADDDDDDDEEEESSSSANDRTCCKNAPRLSLKQQVKLHQPSAEIIDQCRIQTDRQTSIQYIH